MPDCYVGTCQIGPLFFDFNDWHGWTLLVCIVGILVTVAVPLFLRALIIRIGTRIGESQITRRLAEKFEEGSNSRLHP